MICHKEAIVYRLELRVNFVCVYAHTHSSKKRKSRLNASVAPRSGAPVMYVRGPLFLLEWFGKISAGFCCAYTAFAFRQSKHRSVD